MRSARPRPDTDEVSRAAAVLVVIALACLGGAAQALRVPGAPRCPVFPASNPWNKRVDKLPVAQNSAAVISSIGVDTGLHADFGSGLWQGSPIGIPFDVVSRSTKRSRPTFEYDDESDHVGYPIPKGVHIEGGSDHHALLLDKSACRLYELGRPRTARRPLARLGRRHLESPLEPGSAGRLDLRGCRRPPDLPRPRPLRRGPARRDRPRASLHGRAHPARLSLPGAPLCERSHLAESAAHGTARAPEGELRRPRSRARRGSCSWR